MKVEFMVEHGAEFASDMPYKIVETYSYNGSGYDILLVETDDFRKIHIVDSDGTEYEAEKVMRGKRNNETVYGVTLWNPIKQAE